MIQDRPVPRRHPDAHRPAHPDRRGTSRRSLDGRKLFVTAASLAVLLMPANSVAQPDVSVESQLSQGVGAVQLTPLAGSTGTLTQQILQSIRHWKEQPRIVADGIDAPATVSVQAERLNPPAPIVEPSPEEIVRAVWPDDIEDRAVRIAYRESRFVPTARNSCCWGLMQLNWPVHKHWLADYGITDPHQLLDARTNVEMAYVLYQRAGGFGPWQT